MKDKSVYGLAIEDKTTSGEHNNQLEKYNKAISNWKDKDRDKLKDVFKVFYKTCSKDFIWKEEREKVEKDGWKYFDLEKIYDEFWKDYITSQNLIIRMYAHHLKKLLNRYSNRRLPEADDPDSIKWEGFFKGVWERNLKDKGLDHWTCQTNYSYSCICFRPEVLKGKDVPYLEIRSRDCCWEQKEDTQKDGTKVRNLRALILRYYDLDEKKLIRKLTLMT